ncbi:MAG: ureidoglycolate lyase [Granulosicoccus sp.]
MTETIKAQPLIAPIFEGFGDVIEVQPKPSMMINEGNCARYHDLATLDFFEARAGISVFQAQPYAIPHTLRMMERHPLGSQAFLPLTNEPFLVIVAEDLDGEPHRPAAFITNGRQGVNYHRNTWHGVLTPLAGSGLFAVIDRIGEGRNLQEHWFNSDYRVIV